MSSLLALHDFLGAALARKLDGRALVFMEFQLRQCEESVTTFIWTPVFVTVLLLMFLEHGIRVRNVIFALLRTLELYSLKLVHKFYMNRLYLHLRLLAMGTQIL